MNKKIVELREQIDQLDDQIIELLQKRFEVTDTVGEVKKTLKTSVYNPTREAVIYDKMKDDSIKKVYQCIIEESKNRQKKE